MEFNYLPSDVQAEFASVLHEHITNAEKILKSDKCILPMLAIYADDPAENELIGLQPAGKNADTDAAFNGKQFKTAVFSYSTQIVLKEDNVLYDVVKTYIMKKEGTAAIFYTPYYISGFFKKKVLYKSTIIDEITDNFFGLHTT